MIQRIVEYLTKHQMQKNYLTLYLLNLLLNACLLYNVECPLFLRKGIGLFLMIWGVLLAACNVLSVLYRHKRIDRKYLYLFGLLVCMMLSVLPNYRYGFSMTLKISIWSLILFFAVFPFFSGIDPKKILQEISEIVFPALMLWMLFEFVSVIQFVLNITYFVKLQDYAIVKAQGVYYNRLFGIFVDCSLSAVISWNLLVLGTFARSYASKLKRALINLSILLNWIYIVLSVSRSAIVLSCVALSIMGFVYLFNSSHRRNTLLAIVLSVFFAVSLVRGCVDTTGTIMISVGNAVSRIMASTSYEELSLERTDLEDKEDITNLRTQLWRESITAYLDKPISGTSLDGFIPYMQEKYPDSFSATMSKDVGNGYLSVVVYAGPLAALFVLAFIIRQVIMLVPYFIKNILYKNENNQILFLFVVVVDVAVAAAINMDIFYINSADAMLFWLILGAVNALYIQEKNSINGKFGEAKKHEDRNIDDSLCR